MNLIYQTNKLSQEWNQPLIFAFYQEKILVETNNDRLIIPTPLDLDNHGIIIDKKLYIGIINDHPSYIAELPADYPPLQPKNLNFVGLRGLFDAVEDNVFWAAGRAFQIMNWHRTHIFCGRCATPTQNKTNEIAKECPHCGLISYPNMAPAVIVAVVKDDKILLARNKQNLSKFYSVLAGFVEAGETLEDCVRREIMEEVGIKVKNITYFGSQPWPFPNSLMLGFTAEYESGEIQVDGVEIAEADWFCKDELPATPGNISIAHHLIEWFKNRF
ncbi:NAD(+) diphosphatase [Dehalobacterium formicoaceticum]|uniref:NAD(+) diphosphatase n=1 Tax=Dehalobacterium formicoaceticum TaxID=51515 RepID=UPI000B7D1105|nr:NAD(+) diphosphatase [Dehalobacterium formicoaceticum]